MDGPVTPSRVTDPPRNAAPEHDTRGRATTPIPQSETQLQELLAAEPLTVSKPSTDGTFTHSNSHSPSSSTGKPAESTIAPWDKKFLLTLDGGGVRGFSTLLIIQELMKLCKSYEQREDPSVTSSYHPIPFQASQGSVMHKTRSSQFLPVHYFDYIAGTSTGGLIAIMLSRLRMTIDDCIDEYTKMGALIFGKPRIFSMRGPIPWKQEKYDYRKLEAAIKDVVERRDRKADQVADSMFPSTPDRCRTIVVAVRENNSSTQPFLFRTYEHPASSVPNCFELNPGLPTNVAIWQVARATTAAPTYFKPLLLNGEKFLDGGFGTANNPAWHAYFEVGQMNGNIPDAVALTVSIGTGKADKVPPVAKRGAGLVGRYKAIIRYSAATTTDSEATHLKMDQLAKHTGHHYERFNVDGGLGDVDLGEWKVRNGHNLTLEKIVSQTKAYLEQQETQTRLRRVARELVRVRQERSKSNRWDIVATGHRYRCVVDHCRTTLFTRGEDLKMHLVESHGDLGYVRPANSSDDRGKIDKAVRDGKILHAD